MKFNVFLVAAALAAPSVLHAQEAASTPPSDAITLTCTFPNGDTVTYAIDKRSGHAWMADAALADSAPPPPGPEYSIQVDGSKITINKPNDFDPSEVDDEVIDLDALSDTTTVNSHVVNSATCTRG